jgi:hypothetical protein
MSIFGDILFKKPSQTSGGSLRHLIESGRNKNTGGHDHRTNKGDDRTPAQKNGDKKKGGKTI